jgi:hypothetical protein
VYKYTLTGKSQRPRFVEPRFVPTHSHLACAG